MFWPRWLTDLWRLIRAWWTHDRIEVVRSDSRWLQLREGDVVVIGDVPAMICRREVVTKGRLVLLEYTCRTSNGTTSLQVTAGNESGGKLSLIWKTDGHLIPLEADHCEVYSAADLSPSTRRWRTDLLQGAPCRITDHELEQPERQQDRAAE